MLVSEVTKGGAADKAGLKAGDVIVQVDGKSISGVEELRAALNDNFTDDTRKVSLTIVRDHHEQTVNAELTRSQPGRSAPPAPRAELCQRWRNPAQADQTRAGRPAPALAESQRALVQAEVLKQQQQMRERMAAPTPGADALAQGPAQANAEPPRRAASRRGDLTEGRPGASPAGKYFRHTTHGRRFRKSGLPPVPHGLQPELSSLVF